jgi:hypothetical protein
MFRISCFFGGWYSKALATEHIVDATKSSSKFIIPNNLIFKQIMLCVERWNALTHTGENAQLF